jgi:DNA ligase-1
VAVILYDRRIRMTWRRRNGIMLAYPFEEKRLNKWNPPYIVQPKLDGERCRALFTPSGVILLSSEENVIFSVPHINEQLERLDLPIDTELDGELYLHEMPFEYIHSIVGRTVNIHPDHELMNYHIFDLINHEVQYARTFALDAMKYLINSQHNLITVSSDICMDFKDVMEVYNSYVEDGYEGMIVRHVDSMYVRKRSTFMMKFKPKQQDTYLIVGYKEEVSKDGDPKGSLGALVCVGSDGTEFAVGTGFTHAQRADLWAARDKLKNASAIVSYQHITSGKKVPRFPVFVEVVNPNSHQKII